jgi:indolepyruvate ferredoxin oxidoreductase beta subunit
MKNNIILTGVGGQGIITASNILGKAALKTGLNCYVSEVHGMAQRGGSVVCTVRIGDVYGPLVANGTANAIVSTEPIEALRYIKYSNNETKIIVDINKVIPFTVAVGTDIYPDLDKVYKEIEENGDLYKIDANKIAKEAGNIITKNIVLLGALAASDSLMINSDLLLSTILENFPSKFIKINKKAFQGGFKAIKNGKKSF